MTAAGDETQVNQHWLCPVKTYNRPWLQATDRGPLLLSNRKQSAVCKEYAWLRVNDFICGHCNLNFIIFTCCKNIPLPLISSGRSIRGSYSMGCAETEGRKGRHEGHGVLAPDWRSQSSARKWGEKREIQCEDDISRRSGIGRQAGRPSSALAPHVSSVTLAGSVCDSASSHLKGC